MDKREAGFGNKVVPLPLSMLIEEEISTRLFRQGRGPRRQVFVDGVEEKLHGAVNGQAK
jgi:hypothetical protein